MKKNDEFRGSFTKSSHVQAELKKSESEYIEKSLRQKEKQKRKLIHRLTTRVVGLLETFCTVGLRNTIRSKSKYLGGEKKKNQSSKKTNTAYRN